MFKRISVACLSFLIVGHSWADTLPRIARNDPPPEQQQAPSGKTKETLTDAAIIAALIAASIAAYRAGGPGPCACPEDTDRAGRSCGKRSAHSRAGGWTVHCYASDITADMIKAYRASKSGAASR